MLTRKKNASMLPLLLLAGLAAGFQAHAADEVPGADPLYRNGAYVGIQGQLQHSLDSDNELDFGGGVHLFAGSRRDQLAFEVGANYNSVNGSDLIGAEVNALVFPFASSPGLFALAGVGLFNVNKYPDAQGRDYFGDKFNVHAVQAGVGYLAPFSIGSFKFGLRTDLLYRYGRYNDRVLDQRPPVEGLEVPQKWNDAILRVGVYIPLSSPPPPPAEPAPAVVVAPPPDSDGDGVPDDRDQCPNTPAGTQVDDKGCPLAPPCKTPEAGERVSLAGCGTGDVIVLRGVNFEFDKSRLTPNAKIILDGVADELVANPQIKIELSGHTDAKGSDEYNQKLSESRARSVLQYLTEKGIAADRTSAVGYGESKPIADNETDEGRELNRRVELKVVGTAAAGASAAVPADEAIPATETAPVDAEAAPAEAAPTEAVSELPPVE